MPRVGDKLGDAEILRVTVQESDEKEDIKLKYVLPSGREMTSEWMPTKELKATALMSWCQLVRDTISTESEEREAIRKRDEDMDSGGTDLPPPTQTSSTEAVVEDNPEEYIKGQVLSAKDRVDRAEVAYANASSEEKAAVANFEKWVKVSKSLNIEVEW